MAASPSPPSPSSSSSPSSPPPPEDLDWEEWDPSTSPLTFPRHCLAGSVAGVAEHTLLYPLDTVKTCWQSQVLGGAGGGGCGTGVACGIDDGIRGLRRAGGGAEGGTARTAARAAAEKARTKRPWSKRSRRMRNATIEDITSRGMIRASGGGGGAASVLGSTDDAVRRAASREGGGGFRRLWRGVQTMFVGCIPAHALYFSSYEIVKSSCTDGVRGGGSATDGGTGDGHVGHDTLSPSQAALAGCAATFLHDLIMTPMDTVKQRMQLGHYDNLRHAVGSIVRGDVAAGVPGEGWRGLYRSFPVTLATNVPYGMIMMTANEGLRGALEDGLYGNRGPAGGDEEAGGGEGGRPFHFATVLLSGMGAGAAASFATAPLDRIKTRLQTQRMGMASSPLAAPSSSSSSPATPAAARSPGATAILEERALAAARGEVRACPRTAAEAARRALFPSSASTSPSPSGGGVAGGRAADALRRTLPAAAPPTPFRAHYATPLDALRSILEEEGWRGLFRGTLPRVAMHAPSVAISWTAYETAKEWLL
ncbi:hypothetical protein ACHAWF_006145 [Thalassiosira exigua]